MSDVGDLIEHDFVLRVGKHVAHAEDALAVGLRDMLINAGWATITEEAGALVMRFKFLTEEV